ncbi:DUF6615 family protein [Kitasatospora sp. NPDC090308]|uniref:DUF6615 family protein n=1 Tax=Kitasatospora sp. NPDC090308 TaxID=3364082 RepID=UPI003815AE61
MPQSKTTLAAFTASRKAVDKFVTASMRQGRTWGEESVTERLLMAAYPTVRYVEFNRAQEEVVGADWLWWFVDRSGEAFGALVQAKKLKVQAQSCAIDFKHPGGDAAGKQMRDLLTTADFLDVPAVYALYCGTLKYREEVTECPVHEYRGRPCQRCQRASILMLSALAAQELAYLSPASAGSSAFETGVPLEDLVDPEVCADNFVFDSPLAIELANFFEQKQEGVRDIAKAMFNSVKKARQLLMATPEDLGDDTVFGTIPAGLGQFEADNLPFRHILRGLKRELPRDVADAIESDGQLGLWEYRRFIAGVVVVDVDATEPE